MTDWSKKATYREEWKLTALKWETFARRWKNTVEKKYSVVKLYQAQMEFDL